MTVCQQRRASAKTHRALQRALKTWFARAARPLPWRADPSPYKVWLSEIMAQQTRLATVVPYFQRFLKRFPTLERLAAARLEEVLALWSGLGYYSRARNLHRAAQVVVARHQGVLPRDPAALAALPGIGPYTAGAIASIAFGVHAPILDGNVFRVLCRLFDRAEDPRRPGSRARLWQLAAELLHEEDPGIFNEALMELGALICVPRSPACGACPVRGYCLARKHKTVDHRPLRTARQRPRVLRLLTVALRRETDGATLLVQNPPDGLFGGLWQLPTLPEEQAESAPERRVRLLGALENQLGLAISAVRRVGSLEHVLTHRRLRVELIAGVCQGREKVRGGRWRWVKAARDLDRLGVASITRKLLAKVGLK